MPPELSRTLTFKSNGLDEDATLVLIFGSDKITGMYNSVFPVCWRAFKFGKKEPHHLTVTFQDKFSFVKPKVGSSVDIIEDAYTFKHLNVGQETTLIGGDHGADEFTDPVEGTDGYVKATNRTSSRVDMSLGFDDPTSSKPDTPTSVLYFTHIGCMTFINMQFYPVLHGYITKNYQTGQIVREEIDTGLKVWEHDLIGLAPETNWNLTYDEGSGKYKITQA